MIFEEFKQIFREFRKGKDGSIMFVTVGLVILILILTGAAVHWAANLALNQRRYNITDLEKMEPYNANVIMRAQIRQRMIANNPVLFDSDSIDELENNLTRDPSLKYSSTATNIGFYVVSGSVTIPTWSNWMTMNTSSPYFNAFSSESTPRPDNPLFSLWHISYPQVGTNVTNFDITYQLYYWDGGKNRTDSLNTSLADRLPNLTNATYYFTNSIHIRELPASQFQLLSVDQFDTTKMGGNIYLTVKGVTNTNAYAFFPYGVVQGKNNYIGTLNLNANTNYPTWGVTTEVITKPLETPQTFNYDQTKFALRPNLGASWMTDAYGVPEGDDQNSYQNQKFYQKSQHIVFDGQQIWCDQSDGGGVTIMPPFPGITVARKFTYPVGYTFDNGTALTATMERDFGMKRVIIDMRALQPNKFNGQLAYYINCTTPLAKQRGVVVIGADNFPLNLTSILTNGALRLEGGQSVGPLIAGTSYGGIVFTGRFTDGSGNPITSTTWNAYLINTVRPPVTIAKNSGSPVDLGSLGSNYDTVQINGSGGGNIGFGSNGLNGCYFTLGGGNAQAYAVINGTPQLMGTVPIDSGDFEITYKRALNVLSINSRANSSSTWRGERDIALSGIIPRIETSQAAWSGGSYTVTGRSGGSAFYGEDNIATATVTGGLAVGQFITGNLILNVIPPANPNQFFTYSLNQMAASDRFLLFDP